MPRMEIKIEGAGNGIRTHFVNARGVAKIIKIPAECNLFIFTTS